PGEPLMDTGAMAIIYRANLVPDKPTLLHTWLDRQSWVDEGPGQILGAYRFDDPDGKVGVEVFLVRRGRQLLHIPLTYRGEPLTGGEKYLVGTVEHSVLGTRWVYDGTEDEVAVACFRRALTGEQEQAELQIWNEDRLVEIEQQQVVISRHIDADDARNGADQDTEAKTVIPGGTTDRPGNHAHPQGPVLPRPRCSASWAVTLSRPIPGVCPGHGQDPSMCCPRSRKDRCRRGSACTRTRANRNGPTP